MSVLVVGAGAMAREYVRVLHALNTPIAIIGRGSDSAVRCTQETGLPVAEGGVSTWLTQGGVVPPVCIVAVDITELAAVACALIDHGARTILLEKPGGANAAEIRIVSDAAARAGTDVFLAYNRRFYASTRRAKELIALDGGVTSFHFEFTELPAAGAELDARIRAETFLSNSTHVADLAFFLGGRPVEMTSYTAGGLDWHPTASAFTGAGRTDTGALFSYHANWASGGRWSVEVMTRSHRLIFRPLERLHMQRIGSFEITEVAAETDLDERFKPGLFRMTQAVLDGRHVGLATIAEQVKSLEIYTRISPRERTMADTTTRLPPMATDLA